MNNLVSDLIKRAEQLTDTAHLNACIDGQRSDWHDTFRRQFAQLLIEECAELTLDYKNNDHYNGWLDYRNQIRKHFGVHGEQTN